MPSESNANYAWILHILSHLKPLDGVAGFPLANGALGDSDTVCQADLGRRAVGVAGIRAEGVRRAGGGACSGDGGGGRRG